MAQYRIKGGKRLSGEITISGNKNSVLPLLAATLLTEETVTLDNVPFISDVDVFKEVLISLGAEVTQDGHRIQVRCANIHSSTIPGEQSRKLRASILFLGALLGRMGQADFYQPGGDLIGIRTIEPHIEAFKQMGVTFHNEDLHYFAQKEGCGNPEGCNIFLEEATVTGTENLILGAVLGNFNGTIKNCAQEPHIVDLCNMLNQMGAKIEGVGSSVLRITGVERLSGTTFTVGPDFIQLGTFAIAAAITKGEIYLNNCSVEGLEPITVHLRKMGIRFEESDGKVKVYGESLKATPKLHTNIWPGFPTDLLSATIVLATQAQGVSLLHDWMYESRMFFVDKLISMGAQITIADPHRVLVYGPTALKGRYLETPDIRAGMALVLAALVAEGESTINRIELIERGYENVVESLTNLGAEIEKID